MGYLSNLRIALFGRPQASSSFDLTSMSPEQLRDFLRIGGGMEAASGVSVNESSAMRVAAAWRCVNIISGTVGTLPVDLIRRVSEKERQPATGHPLRKVLTIKPNQWQTPSEFRRMMQAHLMLRGNAYAVKVMVGQNVVALIPLHPDRVLVEQLDDMTMRYQVTLKGGQHRIYEGREIFHLRGMSLDGVKGLSVLAHMRESLGLALTSERAGANLMQKGQLVSGVLKHPNKLSPEAYERLKASLAETGGSASSGSTRILEEGMDWESVSMSARDLQFLEQRDFQRYDIAMFFGVPPHMLGATEKQTSWGSGIEQQGIGFVTYTLNDWLRSWEEAIKRDLIAEREWETLDARFFTQGLMRGDVKTRFDAYMKGRQMKVYSANDIRAFEDENPIEGGDVYENPLITVTEPEAPEGEGNEPPQTA